jgi:hypothetical protein
VTRRSWRELRLRIFTGSFAAATHYSIEMTDFGVDALEDRVSAIEEVLAARWPRRVFLRRRLARQLRASDATFAWAGSDFRTRRAEAMSENIVLRSSRAGAALCRPGGPLPYSAPG